MDDYNYDRITISSYTGLKNELMPDTSFITSAILKDPLVIPLTDSVQLSHPVLNVYQKQYEQQLADNGAMSKKYLPKVGIDGAAWVRNSGISYSGAYPDGLSDGMPYNKYNYLMALTVSYNLFDMKHRHDQIVEGRFAAQAKQSALQTQQLAMDQMMLQANSRYQTTLEKLKEIPIQLNSARQAYIQQSALFRSGLNTLIEVTNAQYALLQAETNYVITQDELLQLLYIRAGLAGQLDNFLQNLKR
jgi:outer membrane protein TolC